MYYMEHLKEVAGYGDMIKSLVKRELRGKYKGSVLGFLWTFINPLCQIIVYTIVFSVIVRNDLQQFYVYMITGMIPWMFFDMSLRLGSGCVRYQGDLLKKIYFPREVLPISTVTANFINMLLCFIIVFAVILFSGRGFNPVALICLPMVMMIEYCITLGFVLILSAGTVYFKDLEHITTVLMMAWIYGTPILYPISMIPDKIIWIFKLNPMTAVVESFHDILYWGNLPSWKYMAYAAVWGIGMLVIGELIFNKLSDRFAEEL